MRAGLIRAGVAGLFTAMLLLSPSAKAFFQHTSAAECELYETGHAATFAGTILNAVAVGVGTTNLSCPVLENGAFNKNQTTGVFIDFFLSNQAGSGVTASACANPLVGSVHCGASRSVNAVNTPGNIFLNSADTAPAWNTANIEYGYLAISLRGVGTRLLGYEIL